MKQLLILLLLCAALISCTSKQDKLEEAERKAFEHLEQISIEKPSRHLHLVVDTLTPNGWWISEGRMFDGNSYNDYQKLSAHGQHIVDSLQDAGLPQFSLSQLGYESMYMDKGKKTELYWAIDGQQVVLYKYQFWRNNSSSGFRMLDKSIVP